MRFAWIDEPPFGYLDHSGTPTGCDVALARAACAAVDEPFEPIRTTFAELLPGLADDRWDVTTGMFITAERSTRAHFTRPIWTLRDGLLTRGAPADKTSCGSTDQPAVHGYRALASSGARLAVLRDQVQVQHALDSGVLHEQLVVLDTYEQACAAVLDGTVEACASVALAHEQHIRSYPAQGLRCVVVAEAEAPAAVGGFEAQAPPLDGRRAGSLPHGHRGRGRHAPEGGPRRPRCVDEQVFLPRGATRWTPTGSPRPRRQPTGSWTSSCARTPSWWLRVVGHRSSNGHGYRTLAAQVTGPGSWIVTSGSWTITPRPLML